ncbi:hypothetical protein KJ660_03915 [Candidatus Micrarchaeota archaeon]|nr:hypothetical protein [Candidatus Micrarchaeota archaeon]
MIEMRLPRLGLFQKRRRANLPRKGGERPFEIARRWKKGEMRKGDVKSVMEFKLKGLKPYSGEQLERVLEKHDAIVRGKPEAQNFRKYFGIETKNSAELLILARRLSVTQERINLSLKDPKIKLEANRRKSLEFLSGSLGLVLAALKDPLRSRLRKDAKH